jgi:hypothetical protein
MITKSLFIASFFASIPVLADTLLVRSVYFDSMQTLNEVIALSAQHDNEGIAKLINSGHISNRTDAEMDVVVLVIGSTPDSPAEFRFLNGPTTYWTLTKNVTNLAKPIATPTPVPTPAPLPTPALEPTPLADESPTPALKRHHRKQQDISPLDDDNGQRIWHQVDGKWKWYPANRHHVPVKKASPATEPPPGQ